MKKRSLLLLALICVLPHTEAQFKTYLQLETGPQWSLVRVTDPGGYFEPASLKSSVAGLTINQEVMRNLTVTTGIYYQSGRTGFNMIDERPHKPSVPAYNAFLIPLRAEYRVQLSEFPVSLIPRAGYMYGFFKQPDSPYSASGILSSPGQTAFSYQVQQSFDATRLHMLETGLGVGLRFYRAWQAILNLSYLVGFTEPMSLSLPYRGDDGSDYTAEYHSKGSTVMTTLSLQMPVSNIWQMRDYRIRKRIEGSVYEGKPLERRGMLYIGGELGSLWRAFSSTSAAIGPRPMEDRGIFRYANLHTGIYGGYMLLPEMGIDIGVYYQRSSTFFAIMYDHEVDAVHKSPAPMFLEVPLRVRYYYDLHKQKIYYVVYGGASLLTHFSPEEFGSGGGSFSYTSPVTGAPANADYSYVADRIARFRPLMRIGTGVEALLPIQFPLIATLYVNYMHGFIGADRTGVSTSIPGETGANTLSYNGSGWSLEAGIKLPFSFGDRPVKQTQPEEGDRTRNRR